MGLAIKDGAGDPKFLKSTLAGTEHVVHRHVDSMPATAASSGTPAIPDKVLMVGAQHASGHCVPLTTDSSGFLNTVSTITGVSTLAKQNEIIDKLTDANTDLAALEVLSGTIAGDTTSLDSKVTECNTGAVVLAGGSANIGDVDVASVAIPSAVKHGYKTVSAAATPEVIGSSQAITSGITVKAYASNSGLVFVGDSTVTNSGGAYKGFELSAKESVFIEVSNVNQVYVAVATDGEGVCWIAS